MARYRSQQYDAPIIHAKLSKVCRVEASIASPRLWQVTERVIYPSRRLGEGRWCDLGKWIVRDRLSDASCGLTIREIEETWAHVRL